jgi:L-ascorbate metabolism protein UlaG (beta-lactamase superfamily)
MKITKYQHACLVIEKDGSTLVVDPGAFSHDFIMPNKVDGIIITHEHPDHLDEKLVGQILEKHPKATVIAHENISGRFTDYSNIGAKVGETYSIGTFSLRFFGGTHATIADSIPIPPNLGVLVDEHFYYPGDSFVLPDDVQVKELALPASAPWLKISEAMAFLAQVKPVLAFPTHDAILSKEGKAIADTYLGTVASGQGTQYKRLDGTSVELS